MNKLKYDGAPIKIMEVCGTHTSAIVRSGLRDLLPPRVSLVSGPGCPVCVTSAGYIDKLIEFARGGAVICSFGDMLKVPGKDASLATARAEGADIRVVYSPFDALKMAKDERNKQFVFAAIGFETIAPVYALLVMRAGESGIKNFKLLTALKRITPALRFLSKNGVDGFIAPGHVAAVTGYGIFEPIAHEFLKPFCVAGFSPGNILAAIENLIAQISRGEHTVKNLYPSVVTHSGNTQAMARISDVFEVGDAHWRGLCDITNSGLYLKKEFADFDAGSRDILPSEEICSCGDVILGKLSPPQCHMYGTACTPQTPQGPCMVSSEGACGIWYKCGLGDL